MTNTTYEIDTQTLRDCISDAIRDYNKMTTADSLRDILLEYISELYTQLVFRTCVIVASE